MMTTPRLALPLLVPGQAQKEMSHNEALALLDLVSGAAAMTLGAELPPETPEPGQCWVLGAAPQAEWAGHPLALAGWTDGGWRFLDPREGMQVWIADRSRHAAFIAGEWRLGELRGKVFVEGVQVVGQRCPGIAEPSGGAMVDGPARAAIAAVLDALRVHGLIDSDKL